MLRVIWGAALTLVLAVASFADPATPVSNPDSALALALEQISGSRLSLEEVVSAATASSAELQAAQAALAAAQAGLMQERGAFDPELFANITQANEKLPTASPFSGAAVLQPKSKVFETGARVKLPIGTELSASLLGTKLETNSGFASLSPEYDAETALSIRQPLLQGFGPAGWSAYEQARRRYQGALQTYQGALAALQSQAEAAYWDLYAAERDLAVAFVTRDLARTLTHEAELRAAAGWSGANAVNSAKVFLSEQELFVLDAQDQLGHMSDVLASLMQRRPEAANGRYRTQGDPPQRTVGESEDEAVGRALRSNHELLAAELEWKAAQAAARAGWWDGLPKLDLFGVFGGNGLAGTGRDVIFGSDTLRNSLDTKFGDAIDQALQRDYPSWTIGLNLSVPILLRAERGKRAAAQAALRSAEARVMMLRHAVEERVRATFREAANGAQRIEFAKQGVRASSDQVRIGLIEFQNGVTTAFELVRLGADLATAQRRFSQAQVRQAKAAAELQHLAP